MSKSLRLSKIFNEKTKNTLILPVDHGIGGDIKGLENPIQVLRNLQIPEVDSVLLNEGVFMQAEDVFYGRNAPGKILNSDVFSYEEQTEKLQHQIIYSPEF